MEAVLHTTTLTSTSASMRKGDWFQACSGLSISVILLGSGFLTRVSGLLQGVITLLEGMAGNKAFISRSPKALLWWSYNLPTFLRAETCCPPL